MSIVLFSRKINSGKTTDLQSFLLTKNDIAGLLMPDIVDGRYVFNIRTQEKRRIQVEEHTPNSLKIGKFFFDQESFIWANGFLLKEIVLLPDLLIIDEVGKLELNGLGLSRSVINAIMAYDNADFSKVLILVVRDTLLLNVIEHYQLKNYSVHSNLESMIC